MKVSRPPAADAVCVVSKRAHALMAAFAASGPLVYAERARDVAVREDSVLLEAVRP